MRGLILAAAILCIGADSPVGWCDLLFKEVAVVADNVVIADYRKAKHGRPESVIVVEVLRGEVPQGQPIDPERLKSLRLKDGDQCVLALTSFFEPVRYLRGMGACTAVNALPIRRGRLRSQDRSNYDGRRKPMSLDELRTELSVPGDS